MFTSNHTGADPAAKPIPTEFVATLTVSSAGTNAHSTIQDMHHGIGDLAAAPASGDAGSDLAGATGPCSHIRGYDCVFLL